ncbi:MAG TPA: hypothetical protein VD828_01805 [Candidatus Nitrosotenuis sp.]|nr:hypothetical protein [Candidatus Nitrosotenuis sp.]
MGIDGNILLKLTERQNQESCTMKIGNATYKVDSAEFTYSEVPVTKPTTRGGVYFSDKMAFKVKAKVSDLAVAKVLSKTMLGPNQDFEKILLMTNVQVDTNKKELVIFTNLTNYVQKSSGLELNLVVVGTELSD